MVLITFSIRCPHRLSVIIRRNVDNLQLSQRTYSEPAEQRISSVVENMSEEEAAILNKSRLLERHFCMVHRNRGPELPRKLNWSFMRTLKWQRREIGKFGFDSGFDPALCFPTKEEIADMKEYEKVAFDKTIMEVKRIALEKIAREKQEARERDERASKALASMQSWKDRIKARMIEKENVARAAKEERARLLEEVRRFFGYTIDPKDERFQIMLEHKENEIAKQKKLLRKQKKEERFMAKLASLEREHNPEKQSEEKEQDEEK